MNKHLKYLRYIVLHKWYVFKAACRWGEPWLGFIHDWSKFLPDEWFPYTNYFYGTYPTLDAVLLSADTGAFPVTQEQVAYEFDVAWLKHIHRNKHHWQWYVLREDEGAVKTLPMPEKYLIEMLADWVGAGRALGLKSDTQQWYAEHVGKMQLDSSSRAWLDVMLGEPPCE